MEKPPQPFFFPCGVCGTIYEFPLKEQASKSDTLNSCTLLHSQAQLAWKTGIADRRSLSQEETTGDFSSPAVYTAPSRTMVASQKRSFQLRASFIHTSHPKGVCFHHQVLSTSSGGQPKTVARASIVLGASGDSLTNNS